MSDDPAPIKTRENLYGTPDKPAINAHLHSQLQRAFGAWEGFHTVFIPYLGEAIQDELDRVFPGQYVVDFTKSMQLRTGYSPEAYQRFTPDLSLKGTSTARAPAALAVPEPTLTLDISETINLDDTLTAIEIRQMKQDRTFTWIEILSAANKVAGSGYPQYRNKRTTTIGAGVSLIEIDFLHETSSPIPGVPSYPKGEKGATAYSMAVTDTRPDADESLRWHTLVYGFGVDQPIPTIYVPLDGYDLIELQIGVVYNRVYSKFPTFWERVDYRQPPPNLQTYTPEDQAAIMARMAQIASR
jgi:hypothetical protein